MRIQHLNETFPTEVFQRAPVALTSEVVHSLLHRLPMSHCLARVLRPSECYWAGRDQTVIRASVAIGTPAEYAAALRGAYQSGHDAGMASARKTQAAPKVTVRMADQDGPVGPPLATLPLSRADAMAFLEALKAALARSKAGGGT